MCVQLPTKMAVLLLLALEYSLIAHEYNFFLEMSKQKNVTTFCLRVLNNRFVTYKFSGCRKNDILQQLDDMTTSVIYENFLSILGLQ